MELQAAIVGVARFDVALVRTQAHAMTTVRRIWPVGAFFVVTLVVQAVVTGGIEVEGHAADHLQSATAVFMLSFLLAVIVWAVAADERRRPELWLLIAGAFIGALGVASGNLRVVDSIQPEVWNFEDAERLGPAREGFSDGHLLAQRAALLALATAVALAVWLWHRRMIAPWVAGLAVVVDLIVPYWILPGAGLVVLAIALTVARARGRVAGASISP